MTRSLALAAAFLVAAHPQDTTDKKELRYGFEKGEKLKLELKYALGVKLDKVPDVLQGALGEDLLDLKIEGEVQGEVTGKDEAGTVTVEGRWRTMKVKGHAMLQDIDLQHDADKKEDKPAKKEPVDEGAFLNLQDQFREMSTSPVKFTVDRQGKVAVDLKGDKTRSAILSQLLALNGLTGALPREKVGKGDSWKGEHVFELPLGAASVPFKIRSENKVEGEEAGRVVVASRFKVGAEEGDGPFEVQDASLGMKMKLKGEGEGKTHFEVKPGRPAKSQGSLRVKIDASLPNPGGGEQLDLQATMKAERSHTLGN